MAFRTAALPIIQPTNLAWKTTVNSVAKRSIVVLLT
jgi:hypothetical protein